MGSNPIGITMFVLKLDIKKFYKPISSKEKIFMCFIGTVQKYGRNSKKKWMGLKP